MTGGGGKGEIVANTPVWASLRNATGEDAVEALARISDSYEFVRCDVATKEYVQEAYKVIRRRDR